MKSTQLTDGLIQLTRQGWVNAYLVREDDGFTLIDTTLGGSADALVAAARAAGGEIRRIVLTHGHGDHVGSLDALRERLGPSVEVMMGEQDARIHAGEHVVDGKLPGSWPKITTQPDVRLTGGERIGSLEVVASPGHSPGHMAFLDVRDRTVIAGDVYTTFGRVAVSNHFYWRFPLAQMATWDKTLDVRSAAALRDLEPALLVVGHGPAKRSPSEQMDDAIARGGGRPADTASQR